MALGTSGVGEDVVEPGWLYVQRLLLTPRRRYMFSYYQREHLSQQIEKR